MKRVSWQSKLSTWEKSVSWCTVFFGIVTLSLPVIIFVKILIKDLDLSDALVWPLFLFFCVVNATHYAWREYKTDKRHQEIMKAVKERDSSS